MRRQRPRSRNQACCACPHPCARVETTKSCSVFKINRKKVLFASTRPFWPHCNTPLNTSSLPPLLCNESESTHSASADETVTAWLSDWIIFCYIYRLFRPLPPHRSKFKFILSFSYPSLYILHLLYVFIDNFCQALCLLPALCNFNCLGKVQLPLLLSIAGISFLIFYDFRLFSHRGVLRHSAMELCIVFAY